MSMMTVRDLEQVQTAFTEAGLNYQAGTRKWENFNNCQIQTLKHPMFPLFNSGLLSLLRNKHKFSDRLW